MKLFISAGERSGLLVGELLRQEVQRLNPLAETAILDISRKMGTILGFAEGAQKVFQVRKVLTGALKEIKSFSPDVLVPIAFPGVNLFLGKMAKDRGIKVIYLAPPQVWAWGKFRVRMLQRAADEYICLLPFELELFRRVKIAARYFGYPLFDSVAARYSESETRALLGLQPGAEYIAFLPGSRVNEIRYHQPLFIKVFGHIRRRYPYLKGVIVGGEEAKFPEGMVRVTPEIRYETIRYARLAVLVSGTVTAETALLHTPMVVCYHFSQPSRFLARMFVRLKWFSIPNLVLKEIVVPEFFEPDEAVLRRNIVRLLEDESERTQMLRQLERVKELLGPPGAMTKIAQAVLSV